MEKQELMFDKIRIDYPDLPDRPVASLTVEKIESKPGKNRVRIWALTEKGVKTTIILEKTDNG
jgi:hypothetical protein